jgi:hypothetical protein
MKTINLLAPLVLLSASLTIQAAVIQPEFENVAGFTDFSVSGLSEERTLPIFRAELDDSLESLAKRYLREDETLVIRFTDIDMAGDIQPWRNRNNADIRYVEAVYPPRLKFHYQLKNAAGEVIDEGEASITDMAFQMNTAAVIRGRYQNFFYEISLLGDWLRKTFRNRGSEPEGK